MKKGERKRSWQPITTQGLCGGQKKDECRKNKRSANRGKSVFAFDGLSSGRNSTAWVSRQNVKKLNWPVLS